MITLEDIRKPVSREMKEFNSRFKSEISSDILLVNLVTRFVLRKKGKQMRPLFVFLSSRLTGEITDSTFTAASLIELMHTATLVHDDVVDESNERRELFLSKPSGNQKWLCFLVIIFWHRDCYWLSEIRNTTSWKLFPMLQGK